MDLSWDVPMPNLSSKRPASNGPAVSKVLPQAKRKRPAASGMLTTRARPAASGVLPSPQCNPSDASRVVPSAILPLPTELRVGSMCSGMLSEHWSLKNLENHRALHVWAAEMESYARNFIVHNVDYFVKIYNDVTSKEFHQGVTRHDILVAGFPCQGLSSAGLHRGAADPRTQVYKQVLAVAKKFAPRIVVMENVKGLLESHFDVFMDIVNTLNSMKTTTGKQFKVFSKVLDSQDHGVPHRRKRVYIVAIALCGRNPSDIRLRWPTPEGNPGLQNIWDANAIPLASYKRYPLPNSTTARKRVKSMLALIADWAREEGKEPTSYDVIVDSGSSSLSYGLDCSPCLTKSRTACRDYWSMRHARKLSISELARLQGHDLSSLKVTCTESQLGSMLGNGFSVPVMRKVLKAAIDAAEGR